MARGVRFHTEQDKEGDLLKQWGFFAKVVDDEEVLNTYKEVLSAEEFAAILLVVCKLRAAAPVKQVFAARNISIPKAPTYRAKRVAFTSGISVKQPMTHNLFEADEPVQEEEAHEEQEEESEQTSEIIMDELPPQTQRTRVEIASNDEIRQIQYNRPNSVSRRTKRKREGKFEQTREESARRMYAEMKRSIDKRLGALQEAGSSELRVDISIKNIPNPPMGSDTESAATYRDWLRSCRDQNAMMLNQHVQMGKYLRQLKAMFKRGEIGKDMSHWMDFLEKELQVRYQDYVELTNMAVYAEQFPLFHLADCEPGRFRTNMRLWWRFAKDDDFWTTTRCDLEKITFDIRAGTLSYNVQASSLEVENGALVSSRQNADGKLVRYLQEPREMILEEDDMHVGDISNGSDDLYVRLMREREQEADDDLKLLP